MAYRVGLPLWTMFARMGVKLTMRVDIEHLADCNRYLATSRDLDGLVVEAATLDDLVREVNDCVQMLLEARLEQSAPTNTDVHIGMVAHPA